LSKRSVSGSAAMALCIGGNQHARRRLGRK
jgi:hypothetical protein